MPALDLELESWLVELENDILARNADVGDIQHDSYIAAKCELLNASPNIEYIRRIVGNALSKRSFTIDPELMGAYRRRQAWKGLDS